MYRTYTYKLYKNNKVERKFNEWLGICRFVYNAAKETKDYAYKSGLNLSGYDLSNQLTQCKKVEELSFIKKVNARVLQKTLERLDDGYNRFFNNLKKGIKSSPPHWASKKKYKSIEFKERSLKQIGCGFRLSNFGNVKVFNNRKINGKIKTATLKQLADGLYLYVTTEEENVKLCFNENQVGIDLGIKYFYVTSEGEFVDNPRFLERQLKKLKVEQRKLSRRKRGSKRWYKQANTISRLHKKVTDAKYDFLHKQSTILASTYSSVAIEDLNLTKMIKGRFRKQIYDVGWGAFVRLLTFKVNNLVKVNPAYTSQECSKCGHTCKENRVTQSLFKCVACGHEDNADIDAAKIIEGRAFPNSRQRRPLGQA